MNVEILTKEYNELTLEERVNAIEEAKQAAIEEAKADNGSAGGVEQMTVDYKCYYMRIIEPAQSAELIDDETAESWRWKDTSNDPRVIAFCKAWEEFQKEELKQYEEDMAQIQEEYSENK